MIEIDDQQENAARILALLREVMPEGSDYALVIFEPDGLPYASLLSNSDPFTLCTVFRRIIHHIETDGVA